MEVIFSRYTFDNLFNYKITIKELTIKETK